MRVLRICKKNLIHICVLIVDYTEKLDIDNAKTFGQYEFLDACKEMGITVEQPNV